MAAASSRGLMGLFKKGMAEIPEVMGSGFMALIGVGMGVSSLIYYYNHDLDNRKYKLEYTVIRDDDPKADKVRKD